MSRHATRSKAYLRSGEVADELGVDVATIRRWCAEGLIAHWRTPSNQLRIRPEAVEAFVAERTTEPNGAA